jgi:beta-glucanase (GH16 family)
MGGAAGSAVSGTGGGAGTIGSGGVAGGGGSEGDPSDPHFKLAWRDEFDTFDSARWTKQTHTFVENLAKFSADNVVVEGGLLKLKVTFGRFAGRIKFCAGSGLVSSLFTYKDDVDQSWQEIDIEHLGNLPKSIQYNLISGNLSNRVYQPKVVTFPWSPVAEFHDYRIDWRPDGVTFVVDGKQTHQDVQATLKDPARLHMNAWPTNNAITTFAGTFDPNAVPCEAQYDWVEAYTYIP